MKKNVLLCLFLVTLLALTGCSPNQKGSPVTPPTNTGESNETGENASDTTPKEGEEEGVKHPNQLVAANLTPENATILAENEYLIMLHSKKPMSELIAFYTLAVEELDAKQTDLTSEPGLWSYKGTYGDDDKTLMIRIVDDEVYLTISLVF